MENKDKHIDKFLDEKFRHFESEPDADAFQPIESVLEHLIHPIDQALNNKLTDFKTEPSPGVLSNLMDNPQTSEHPIDHLLNEKLLLLEVQPKGDFSGFDGTKDKKKRISILVFLSSLSLLLIGLTTFHFSQSSKAIQSHDDANKTVSTNQQNQLSNSLQDNNSSHPANDNVKAIESTSQLNQSKFRQSNNVNTESIQLKVFETALNIEHELTSRKHEFIDNQLVSEEMSNHSLHPIGIQGFKYPLKVKPNEKVRFNKPRKLFAYSPLYFHFSMGISMENNSKNHVASDNIHKDAIDLYQKSNGKNKSGLSFSIGMGHQITKRIDVKIGFKYTEFSTSQNLNYVYTDLPVYDTTGQLKGYIYRSPSNSPRINQTIKSKSTYLSAPIQLNFGVFQTRLLKLSLGVGMEYNFTHTSKGEFFNFNTSKMEAFGSKSKNNWIPGLSINGLYRIHSGIQLIANLGFQRMKLNQTIGGIEMRSTFGIPTLSLGLIYTPILKL